MISEQITVTTTLTSVRQLIATARSVNIDTIPNKCIGIMLRYDRAETKIVTMSDANSVTGVVILDALTEILLSTSIKQFNSGLVLLSCNSGTVTVHILIEQDLM